jgi:fucose permease
VSFMYSETQSGLISRKSVKETVIFGFLLIVIACLLIANCPCIASK